MNPEAHEAERGLGVALRAMLAAWLVLAGLQILYAASSLLQLHYLASRPYPELPGWLRGSQEAFRLLVLPPMWLLTGAALRYGQVTLARDRGLALAAAAALGLALVIDLVLVGHDSLARAELLQPTLSWFRLSRWIYLAQGVSEAAGLGLLGAALALGGHTRGARTQHWLWAPMVLRALLPYLLAYADWLPNWRNSSQVLLVYGGLLALLVVATALYAWLLLRCVAVTRVAERRAQAGLALRGHAGAMLARVVVLVGVAVLTVAAARARSLDLLKFVMVVGPLATFVIGVGLIAATARFAWSSVDGGGLMPHLALGLVMAPLLLEAHGLVLVIGLFWGRGSIMERAQVVQQVAPVLSLFGQVIGVAALLAMLRALARVGGTVGVPDAAGRALRIGGGLLALLVAMPLLSSRMQLLGARTGGVGTMVLLGVLLLAAAVALLAAYIKLVREVADTVGPAAPRW
ncbi:MAG: hypothetical protein IT370_22540 [Deltaproteobacteria bacterium]|nr:hypothetical protein [Deltaproteobacteria bacterium]